jgi:SAM-dependent methyltransferase
MVVHTDVSRGPNVDYVCDAHDIPFADGTFDLVVAASVLEHVADPFRVVDEFFRVLKPEGYVFAVTPFMQPNHLGVYDFTRFTFVGYRRLFRRFDEIEMGVALGPGSSLAYAIRYFFAALSENRRVASILSLIGLLISRPLKYLDKVLNKKKSAIGCAAGYLFFGRRSETVLSDRELVESFKDRIV